MKRNSVFGRLFFTRLPAIFAIVVGTLGGGVSFNASADCVGYIVQRYYMDNYGDDFLIIKDPVTGVKRTMLLVNNIPGISTTALRSALMNLYLSQKPATFLTTSTSTTPCGADLLGVIVGNF